jgi:hypothetical protein
MLFSYLIGGRDAEFAVMLMDNLRDRLANRVQLTTERALSLSPGGRGSLWHARMRSGALLVGSGAILGREVHFNIRWQPMQCPRHDGGNRRLIGTGGAAPKTRHVGLEIFALHNIV